MGGNDSSSWDWLSVVGLPPAPDLFGDLVSFAVDSWRIQVHCFCWMGE